MNYLTLNNNEVIPQLGMGCPGIYSKKEIVDFSNINMFFTYCKCMKNEKIIYDSESVGYQELLLGSAIKFTNKRENIFLIGKLSNYQQRTMSVKDALERSLRRLKTDYLDLYLMHWPQTGTFVEKYKEMEELLYSGKVKAIGVCNFNKHHLEDIFEKCSVVPAVNQIEIHPLFSQEELVKYCFEKGIIPMAYSPLCRMHDVLIKAKILRELSAKYKKTIPQIILRWHIQRGVCVIPRTSKFERVSEYKNIFDFELNNEDMDGIFFLNDNVRIRYNPDKCDFLNL